MPAKAKQTKQGGREGKERESYNSTLLAILGAGKEGECAATGDKAFAKLVAVVGFSGSDRHAEHFLCFIQTKHEWPAVVSTL